MSALTFREQAAIAMMGAAWGQPCPWCLPGYAREHGSLIAEKAVEDAQHLARNACDAWGHDFPRDLDGTYPKVMHCARCGMRSEAKR